MSVTKDIAYPLLDTPAVLVDMNKLEANIKEMSQLAAEAGVKIRPHVKVHECAEICRLQIEAGACGVDVGSLGQAEALAEVGIDDIIIAHPTFYGGPKYEKLKKLLSRPGLKVTVVVDMIEQAEIVSQIGQALGRKIPVLPKVDTNLGAGGFSRVGVLPGKTTLDLSKQLCQLPGIEFLGVYSHENSESTTSEGNDELAYKTAEIITETARMLRKEGIPVEHVSVGSSPTFRASCRYIKEGKFPEITEIHPGNCVIGDILYSKVLGNPREACVATVLASVMTTSHPNWAVIDAGFKTLGGESLIGFREEPGFFWNGMPRYSLVKGRPDLWLGALSGELSQVYYTDHAKERLQFGERLEIVPNNAAIVINLQDKLYGVRNGVVEREFTVTARGCGT
ncbi:MAG: alanine racemase [Dehalococcoidales bacterium]|mgnify:CR=1 FL=1|jgi:D-serine deaminase-like pyridoxal phosphate-dependent protein|nr:alanine racemase [Dehalococcoidales bacterium]MDP6825385.1 alanine racemase [Dehalococcoidales bacterium]